MLNYVFVENVHIHLIVLLFSVIFSSLIPLTNLYYFKKVCGSEDKTIFHVYMTEIPLMALSIFTVAEALTLIITCIMMIGGSGAEPLPQ
jgi:hypothetical protein